MESCTLGVFQEESCTLDVSEGVSWMFGLYQSQIWPFNQGVRFISGVVSWRFHEGKDQDQNQL